jgi:hypothetical protein
MNNRIIFNEPEINGNRITATYSVEGEWEEIFHRKEQLFVEYSIDVSAVPTSIAIIPFLANVLPIAWVCDAEIVVPSLDKDFYESIPEFKKGYIEMFPAIEFKGSVTVKDLVSNVIKNQEGALAFFSGGVDAFNTLTNHIDEKPALFTLWGADVKLEDEAGWSVVESHISETAKEFELDYYTVKSSFRRFFNEWKMTCKVEKSGDNWWHGFQHGLGIISHAAPVMYVLKKNTIYFASSFTAADKGKVTCASDPTIDNYIRFCGSHVIHDGYEFNRQGKIHNITQYAEKSGRRIPLRVCWESSGGSNCCKCEKCWRTMMGIYAEGFNPKDFGFEYDDFKSIANYFRVNKDKMRKNRNSRYGPILKKLRENYTADTVDKSLRWLYKTDIQHLGEMTISERVIRKIKRKLKMA